MTYIIGVCILAISGVIGYCLSTSFSNKNQNIKCLLSFCDYLLGQIGFKQEKLENIFDSYINGLPDKMKQSFLIYKQLMLNPDYVLDKSKLSFLNNAEIIEVTKFFKSLGTSCGEVEKDRINAFKKSLEGSFTKTIEKNAQNGGLSFKLSLAIGLVIAIIII